MEDLKAENEKLRALLREADERILAKDSLLLQNANCMQGVGERITRMESIGSRFAREMRSRGLMEFLVEEWEMVTGGKVGE